MGDFILGILENSMSFLTFFVPGFSFIVIYYFLTNRPFRHVSISVIVYSVVISFFLQVLLRLFLPFEKDKEVWFSFILLIMTFVLAVLFSLLSMRVFFQKALPYIHRTLSSNVEDDFWLLNKGKVVLVRIKKKKSDLIYTGQAYLIGEGKKCDYILTYYTVEQETKGGRQMLYDFTSIDGQYVLFRGEEIGHIAFEISDDSKGERKKRCMKIKKKVKSLFVWKQ